MSVGIFAGDVNAARAQIDGGCTLIALGADSLYLWRSAKQALSELRGPGSSGGKE
jgi:hypothetical protein